MKISFNATALFGNHSRLSAERVNDRLLRIFEDRGRVLGHIESVRTANGDGFTARRLIAGSIRSLDLGFFWNIHEAAECFR